ncbi:hypothetical protein QJS04_geneDACA013872 [Acorus gramineus]|uniref:Uncharacterized protein n=1 Tax=Acorus gramineus TaxID=55184 RepID=A0AAV9AV25_ACOGR|nr:hypothetical protein QJS04_geneDACA013872 [Acorus gramineus]
MCVIMLRDSLESHQAQLHPGLAIVRFGRPIPQNIGNMKIQSQILSSFPSEGGQDDEST